MKKREASFQTIFNQYLRVKKLYGHFELKQTTGNSISFNAVKQHQVDGLMSGSLSPFVWKYSDEDQREKPFDCSCIPPIQGYVVIKYPGIFYIIRVQDFIIESRRSERKSLTSDRAKEICHIAVSL